jgi:hypothetical protein
LSPELRNRISGYIRSRDFDRLSSLTAESDPTSYDQRTFTALRQVEAFFKKNASFIDDVRCTNAAVTAFEVAEESCKVTNSAYDALFNDPFFLGVEFEKQARRVKRFLSAVLGSSEEAFKSFVKKLPSAVRVTGGATATTSRIKSRPYQKLTKEVVCSENAVPYLEYVRNHGGYAAPRFTVHNVNRIEFVSKNSRTHRTIACEPAGNVPLQLAFDSYAKTRLRRFGIDLSSQVLNQELARQGSLDESYATLDLKSASDTVAFNVVQYFFPKYWRGFLSDVRTPCYDSKTLGTGRYHKFSSMGNGSTFAIETLLFSAACYAVSGFPNQRNATKTKRWNVYGDDIVIATEFTEPLVLLLARMGFSVNVEKSFYSGPFRESCGMDWWRGINITPFYLRSQDTQKTTISHNVNGLVRLGWEDSTLWIYLRNVVRSYGLIQVPFNENTQTGILIPVPRAYAKKLVVPPSNLRRPKKGTHVIGCSPLFKGYRLVQKKAVFPSDSVALYLWFLAAVSKGEFSPLRVVAGDPLDLTFEVCTSTLAKSQRLKYRVDSLRFWPSMVGTPAHLYEWADWLDRTASPTM